jgi:hypothetical protein
VQVFFGLSLAGQALLKISLGGNLIQDAVGVGDASKCKRNRADPNRLGRRGVTPMNSRQQTLPPGFQRQWRSIGPVHAAVE